jgi:hypothetical protein
MMRAMQCLPTLVLTLICIGCEGVQSQQKPQPGPTPPPVAAHSRFVVYASAGETFLLDSETGKAWRYDVKEKAFKEIPVTSNVVHYDSHGNPIGNDLKGFTPF